MNNKRLKIFCGVLCAIVVSGVLLYNFGLKDAGMVLMWVGMVVVFVFLGTTEEEDKK